MTNIVKVSLFLPPAAARAVKFQAARQGGGMSELGANVILSFARVDESFRLAEPPNLTVHDEQ